MSLDGFMSGPDCELGWHFEYWNTEMAESFCEQLGRADTLLFGRNTYNAMAQHWQNRSSSLTASRGDLAFTEMMTSTRKIVCSRYPQIMSWKNSASLSGDIPAKVAALKKQEGKDMIIFGSGQLIASLARHDLIDQYLLWIHPVALGKGKPLFRNEDEKLSLNFRSITTFRSGVMMARYDVLHQPAVFSTGSEKRRVKKAGSAWSSEM